MATLPRQGDLFKTSRTAQGRLALRPMNSARRSREHARSMAGGLLPFAALFLVLALGFVWLRIQGTEIKYRQSTLREVVMRLENEHHDLANSVAAAESPAQLEPAARDLALVPPALPDERPLR